MNPGFVSVRIFAAFAVLIAATITMPVHAQDGGDLMRRISGSWSLVDESLTFPDGRTIKSWGDRPLGFLGFDPAGHFSMMMMRSDLPRFETRASGTAQQNEAIAKGVIAYYGTFAPGADGTSVVMKITGSTFTAFNGVTSHRPIEFRGPDEMIMRVAVPNSGVRTELVWRRAKL